jgi:hypothetical protein
MAAGDTTSVGQTSGRQKVNESARRQPEDLPAEPDAAVRPADSLTEKVKSPGRVAPPLAECPRGCG